MQPSFAAAVAAAPLVDVRGLARIYEVGGQTVTSLVDVDLAIDDGEYVAIMGPSGSGKSTMLNILGCLDRPTRGTYRVAGEDTAELDSDALASLRNRRIGFCFQSFNLLPRSTALENVILPLVYAGVPRREREAMARGVLEEVGLAGRTHHRPSQLSGGQQQRVAIARAMVTSPDILLCDEPTGALDSSTGLEIMALLARLNADGRTVIIVTHDPAVAAHAHRVVRLRDGRIESDEATGSGEGAPAPHQGQGAFA